MKTVAIFRHQHFKVSEPFIVQQSSELQRYRPLYVGRERLGVAPAGAESLVLADIGSQWRFASRAWQVITRDVRPYVRLLGERRPNLIHAHFGVDGVYALPLALRFRIPLVTTFHGFDATTSIGALLRSGSPAWVNYILYRRQLATQGALFLCVSKFILDKVLALGFPRERTHVHYTGIDVEVNVPRSAAEEQLFILHVARLVEIKGTEYVIRSFARVAKVAPEVQLIIIGDGPLRSSLQSLAGVLGISERVQFMGAQSHQEVMSWMRKALFLVLPSVTTKNGNAEGLGMVFLEASALAVPVLGTRHGGIPEVVLDGKTGFLVPERNVDLLAKRSIELISDKGRRAYMGDRARAHVTAHFNISKQSVKLETFYDSVLQ